MFELNGRYNMAKVFTDICEPTAISQIINMCNQEAFAGSQVRIMPNVHAGKGCTIGTTMTITDKVVPNLVGVDIGCGMRVAMLGKSEIDFARLDDIIHKNVPSGFSIRQDNICASVKIIEGLSALYCREFDEDRAIKSVGTLGGGNHFIEVDEDDEGNKYLVIHTGSRNLGKAVAEYYQKKAIEAKPAGVPDDFAYCEGELLKQYLHDMKIVQEYAMYNRYAIADVILNVYGDSNVWKAASEHFTTVHNYIDLDNMILRKGSVSAQAGEKLIIPINMRDGSLICIGKGNPDWNYSAPHGAGRLMSRSEAKASITLEEFQESMKGIYTTSVKASTLDESPMAYKSIDDIVNNIGDTVEVVKVIKPVYNFKAGD